MHLRNLGPAGMSGRVTSVDVVHSNAQIIYVGTASGGIWRSTSGGIRWDPVFDDQPVQAIGAVTIQQSNPDVIWAGTGEGNPRNSASSGKGIYKSIDGGHSWTCMGLEATKTIHRIIIHKDDPNTVYVGATGSAWGANKERGVFKTTDGGKSWEKILFINDLTGCADLVTDPSNPNKLIAAMWEYHREPWFFTSGGKGSGIYITFDGGTTWEKRTQKEGLPEGEYGRIGLAIAPSKPEVIYALVETKKTGLYRSDDGGFNWHKVADKNIGNRPFYYADIYVDPKNENRIYNLYSVVSMSEDGGKTFSTLLPTSRIHPDHHAWWIHPEDPCYIINGNDGGLNISRDRGKTWRFVENLPVAQFYHINVDNEIPYNIYGGMQDNGSWCGPGYVWQNGGIRNHHWQDVLFGDGFDVMPDADNNRYGYAMYQGGNLYYYDIETGKNTFIQPIHPDGVPLRFNWNAPLAQNPFHKSGIYFGSQFLHKSMDKGNSWKIISPDLTTNNKEYQKQTKSGGLTIDATRAENYTTISAIAPSPLDENVIWVGTDDGKLQLTKDGGKTWENLMPRLKGVPNGALIPQIVASEHHAGEVFVVINNYRLNDWKPYVYKSDNYGKKWVRLVGENDVDGHCHAIVQDPVAENLLFLGTEYGWYGSVDGGASWNKWKDGFPSCPVVDLKIQKREHDLVIGTFGRSAWILDNILPLRTWAMEGEKIFGSGLFAFQTPPAYLVSFQPAKGVPFHADAYFRGQNKRNGAAISFWINKRIETEKGQKEKDHKADRIRINILNVKKDTIRTFHVEADTGFNLTYWDMRADGYFFPGHQDPEDTDDLPPGASVIPGKYTAHLTYGSYKSQTTIEVFDDPRIERGKDAFASYQGFSEKCKAVVVLANAAFYRLKKAKKIVESTNSNLKYVNKTWKDSLQKYGGVINDSIHQLMLLFTAPENFGEYDHITERINNHLAKIHTYIWSGPGNICPLAYHAMDQTKGKLQEALNAINAFFEKDWPGYEKAVKTAAISPFEEFKPLRLEEH